MRIVKRLAATVISAAAGLAILTAVPGMAASADVTLTEKIIPETVSAETASDGTLSAVKEFTYAEQETWEPVTHLELKPGESVDLRFKGVPDYRDYTCRWTSSDSTVARVDNRGVVTALADGFAEISLTIGNGDRYTSEPVIVMVSNLSVTIGTASERNLGITELTIGETIDLNFYGISDWNSRKGSYLCEWESSNEKVVTVRQKDGVVTGIAKGTAVVSFWIFDMEKGVLLKAAPLTVTVKQ